MYGGEDGTIPATFQIIYMVYLSTTASKQVPKVKCTDRMEALSKPAEISGKGIRYEKPQGYPLSFVWSSRASIHVFLQS
jgi:hypothetical protein